MAFYVRKISRSKWEKGSQSDPDADAITGCTRTSQNTLSLWLVENDFDVEVDKAFLALACSMERADGFEVLLLEEQSVNEA
ncbi:MAG TPA: hypothetical protein VNX01_07035, partial [Bacteroidia bacterium]|nr:hypothetical protein [Bacteroidia bacterium]